MATRAKRNKFPLGLHKASGQWVKKFEGKPFYFGTNQDEALERYVKEWPRIVAGDNRFGEEATPTSPAAATLIIRDLANSFLTAKRQQLDCGELSGTMFSEYFGMAEGVVLVPGSRRRVIDLQPGDFGRLRASAAKRLGPVALSKFITMTRTMFGFAASERLIPTPVWYGDRFNKPERKTLRAARNAKPKKFLNAEDCYKLILHASIQLRAMIYLGLNCGYGASDCAKLPRSALTIRPAWIIFPRPKTETERRCPLWPETIKALAAVHAIRPEPKIPSDSECVFLTTNGMRWVRFKDRGIERRGTNLDAVLGEFKKVAKKAGVAVPGGFYTLRHTHRTIADGAKDRGAADVIMGHVDQTMAGHYVEDLDDGRLQAIVDHVRKWLLQGRRARSSRKTKNG